MHRIFAKAAAAAGRTGASDVIKRGLLDAIARIEAKRVAQPVAIVAVFYDTADIPNRF